MAKKNIAIVYNQSLTQVQGINFVNSSFVEGQRFFARNNFELLYIYSPCTEFICKDKASLSLIGSDYSTNTYNVRKVVRGFLRKLLSSNYLLGASIKIYFNHLLNAKKAVKRMLTKIDSIDYIIFQDVFSAAYYQKIVPKEHRKKNILILHCANHELEQFKPLFKGFFKYEWLGGKLESYLHNALFNVNKVVYLNKRAMNASPITQNNKSYIFNGKDDIYTHVMDVSSPLNFVIVASTIYHKGHHILLDALSMLRNEVRSRIRMYIIGNGTELDVFKRISSSLQLDDIVTFMGNRNDVPEILKQMDVFILPSISEGMPMSIIEAMRQGLYIMATPVGGIPEMLQPTFSKFIERTPESITESITEVVIKGVVTKAAKQAAREHYLKNFTLQRMIDSYSKILLSL